ARRRRAPGVRQPRPRPARPGAAAAPDRHADRGRPALRRPAAHRRPGPVRPIAAAPRAPGPGSRPGGTAAGGPGRDRLEDRGLPGGGGRHRTTAGTAGRLDLAATPHTGPGRAHPPRPATGGSMTVTAPTRPLGRRGPGVSAIGVGTWALGGPFTMNGRDAGWGEVDDAESVRALHAAIDAGVTLIDTAPTYGTGHSERIIGRALAELPRETADRIVVATKFGNRYDEESRTGGGSDVSPAAIRAECDASLRRLGVPALGLFQLHGGAEN